MKCSRSVLYDLFYDGVFLQVKKVLSLKMGSNQADHKGQSGLCFAMDWLHVKPHNLLAAGFYDGDFICFVFRSICSSKENCKNVNIFVYLCRNMFHFTFSFPGLVGLWDLASKSTLLKVKSPDGVVSLFPYHCFHAHDENIRTLSWCKASR